MYRVPQRLYRRWRELDQHARVQASLVFGIGLLGLVHYLVFCIPQQFYIEDAGISFTYAKHLVEGEGLVTYPGGERVKGYSNPTLDLPRGLVLRHGSSSLDERRRSQTRLWILDPSLCVWNHASGTPRTRLDQSTRSVQVVERGHRLDKLALLAPLLLVISPPVRDLECLWFGKFPVLSVAGRGTYRVVLEGQETHRRLISPWWFTLLAMTDRKASFMVPLDFLAVFLGGVERRNWQRPLQWLALLLVPWGLYQWWRFTYFGNRFTIPTMEIGQRDDLSTLRMVAEFMESGLVLCEGLFPTTTSCVLSSHGAGAIGLAHLETACE